MADILCSARQDSLSRHTKVHDNPAKRRRSSAIAPLTSIAPAGPSTEQVPEASNTDDVVDQPPQHTATASLDFSPPINHYQPSHYSTLVSNAAIDPMLMHDPAIMPQAMQHQHSIAIDPMLNDDISHFATFAPNWHEPKNMPHANPSQETEAWNGAFPPQQPQNAMIANPYYIPDGLSMQTIRDQQRPEWPQQNQHQL